MDLDLLPEEVEWQDEGCELFSRCLDCPLPRCVEEEPRWRQKLVAAGKKRKIAELKGQGMSHRQIAQALGISIRTVERAIGKNRALLRTKAQAKGQPGVSND